MISISPLPPTLLDREVLITCYTITNSKTRKVTAKTCLSSPKEIDGQTPFNKNHIQYQLGKIKMKMNARRKPVNENDTNKFFVIKVSNNHIFETHVTKAYTPIYSYTL